MVQGTEVDVLLRRKLYYRTKIESGANPDITIHVGICAGIVLGFFYLFIAKNLAKICAMFTN